MCRNGTSIIPCFVFSLSCFSELKWIRKKKWFLQRQSWHCSCSLQLPGPEQRESDCSAALLTQPGPLCLVSVSIHKKAVMGDTVPEPWRCSNLLQRHHLHDTPVNVVRCHDLVVWEDDWVHQSWRRINQDSGLVNLPVNLLQKLQLKNLTPPP